MALSFLTLQKKNTHPGWGVGGWEGEINAFQRLRGFRETTGYVDVLAGT